MTYWGSAPIILVSADTEEGVAAATRSVEATGGRIAASVDIDTAAERLESQVAIDLVWVDIAADHGPILDRLLERLVVGTERGDFAALIVIPSELVDIVASQIGGSAVSILVGRNERALDAALADRLARAAPQLREDGGDEAIRRHDFPIESFEQVHRPVPVVREGGSDGEGIGYEPPPRPAVIDAGAIRDMIRARRLRDELFGAGLFADPAWDMLLDLMAARLERRPVAVSSLCIAAAVPATTALRWIKQLTEAGLLRRVADPDDGRRVFIELTDHAASVMEAYFTAMPAGARG
ncbi:winged helix DNA-binding protein [Sphingomonas histidinilytica]|uniref:winged helix DNA-binding protein n=1 Tax=Rhizorhabdus histidinilytica TaxID=439228 RepID=UPI001ADCE962|nr:winged helix DNA-binding protein [Rhizorhabdus histidinilytica]MBO9378595.1 winged helix DNA-binding protein [Rhizorhabdus histidinilytica]